MGALGHSSTISRRPIKPAREHQSVPANLQQQQQSQQAQQHHQQGLQQAVHQQTVPQDDVLHDLNQHVMDDPSNILSPTTATAPAKKRKSKSDPSGVVAAAGQGGPATAPGAKRPRTNTPWTPQEEQRLKTMRDAGNSWSEIAKTFPNRTEGSVKKHWYKV